MAPEGLSADGTTWSAWAEIETAEALPNLNIYRVRRTFAYPTATIAFRVPYTPTYLKDFCARLETAKFPGVCIDTIGTSAGGRPLTVIRLEDPQPAPPAQPEEHATILVIAREHATEHASRWAAHGALVNKAEYYCMNMLIYCCCHYIILDSIYHITCDVIGTDRDTARR